MLFRRRCLSIAVRLAVEQQSRIGKWTWTHPLPLFDLFPIVSSMSDLRQQLLLSAMDAPKKFWIAFSRIALGAWSEMTLVSPVIVHESFSLGPECHVG